MYNRFQLAFKYIAYYLTASNAKGHGMHSPFVYDFIINVLQNKGIRDKGFDLLNRQLKDLKKSDQYVNVDDLGAGSGIEKKPLRSVARIAKYAVKPIKYSTLLFRIAKYYTIGSILELGTSLGVTTGYLALAKPKYGVITIEGAPEIAQVAKRVFEQHGLDNIRQVVGNFDHELEPMVLSMKGSKMIFFDGNHQFKSTIEYFNTALAHSGEYDIFVFDDIHWSSEMENAWDIIRGNDRVTLAIDLFFIGIVFFRKDFKEKLDFRIRF
jgi:predicted O-methyltransferase YrrM